MSAVLSCLAQCTIISKHRRGVSRYETATTKKNENYSRAAEVTISVKLHEEVC